MRRKPYQAIEEHALQAFGVGPLATPPAPYHYCPRCRSSTRVTARLVEQAPRPLCVACHTEGVYLTLDELNSSASQLEHLVKERLVKTKEAPAAIAGEGTTALVPCDSRDVVMFRPEDLEPDPRNPRGPVKPDGVEDLAGIIRAFGQKVPCLVRPKDGGHMVVLGHRRRVVAQVLEREVPCFVEDLSDDAAFALMLAEQGSAKAFDVFAESDAVADLLSRKCWTVESVALALGKSRAYVAARSNLRNLSKAVREVVEDPQDVAHMWPVDWLEEIAKLAPEAQEALVQHANFDSKADLEHVIRQELRVLGKAPWVLDDAALVPDAGACSSCPYVSTRHPDLFGDLVAADVSEARCLSGPCYARKTAAHAKKKLAELRKVEPKTLAIAPRGGDAPKGLKNVVRSYEVHDAKKSDKGAVLAVDLATAETRYVLPPGVRSSSGSSPTKDRDNKPKAEKPLKERLRESRTQIGDRRLAFVVDAVREAIAAAKSPKREIVLGLAAAYGVDGPRHRDGWLLHGLELPARKKLYDLSAEALTAAIWPWVRDPIAETLIRHQGLANVSEFNAAAVWLAELLGIDVGKLQEKAAAEIPDPKWWGKADLAQSPAGKAKASRKGKKPGAEAPPIETTYLSANHWADPPHGKTECGLKSTTAGSVTTNVDFARCGRCAVGTSRSCRGCKRNALAISMAEANWVEVDLCTDCTGEQPKGKKKTAKSKA